MAESGVKRALRAGRSIAALVAAALMAGPAAAEDDQALAKRHIQEALSLTTGRQVVLPNGASQTRAQLKVGARLLAGALGGAAGLAIAQTLRPTLTVRDDLAATLAVASANGRFAAVATREGPISMWDLEQGREVFRTATAGTVRALAVAEDGGFVVAALDDGRLVRGDARAVAELLRPGAVSALALGPGGLTVAVATGAGPVSLVRLADGRVTDLGAAARLLALRIAGEGVQGLAADGSRVRLSPGVPPQSERAARRSALSAAAFGSDGAKAVGISAEGALIRIDGGGAAAPARRGERLVSAAVVGAGDVLLAVNAVGDVDLLRTSDGARAGRLVITRDGWAVLDESGRFDGSSRGLEALSWKAGDAAFNISALAGSYFEPGVLSNIVAGTAPAGTPPPPLGERLKLPPQVTVVLPAGEPTVAGGRYQVVVVAEDRGTGVEGLRLFHNGKITDDGALVQLRDYQQGGRAFRAAAYRVSPGAGINTFRAVAVAPGGMEGTSARRSAVFTGPRTPGALRVLAVGIDQYQSPLPRLRLAAADAAAVAELLELPSPSFASVDEVRLLDGQATRAEILKQLDALVDRSRPEDTLVVFLAGHGFATGPGEWLFGAADADATGVEALRASAVSAADLQARLVRARASKIVLAIDACQSASAFGAFLQQRSLYARLLGDIGRTTGITVFAATQEGANAYEARELGHGVFSYSLLEALRGPGEAGSGGGPVTAFQVADHLERSVPILAQTYKGGRQDTAVFRLGVDFPLR